MTSAWTVTSGSSAHSSGSCRPSLWSPLDAAPSLCTSAIERGGPCYMCNVMISLFVSQSLIILCFAFVHGSSKSIKISSAPCRLIVSCSSSFFHMSYKMSFSDTEATLCQAQCLQSLESARSQLSTSPKTRLSTCVPAMTSFRFCRLIHRQTIHEPLL